MYTSAKIFNLAQIVRNNFYISNLKNIMQNT